MSDYNAIPHFSTVESPALYWHEAGEGELQLAHLRLPLTFRRSMQARRLSMKLNPDRRLTVTGPRRATVRQVEAFVLRHADWVQAQIGKLQAPVLLLPGALVPVLGQTVRLEYGAPRGGDGLSGGALTVTGPARQYETRLKHWLHAAVRQEIRHLADAACARGGLSYRAISLRDTISRWGSCSRTGSLSFSWRLVFAPHAVLDYVVCHEIAHLRHMDHSPRFWGLVETLMPGYAAQRDWLMSQGHALHRYRFAPLP